MDATAVGQHNVNELAYWGLRLREAYGDKERIWKLAGYARLAAARAALFAGQSDWARLPRGTLQTRGAWPAGGLSGVVSGQSVDRFKKWLQEDPSRGAERLGELWAPGAAWPASMGSLLSELTFLTPGLRLKLVSVLAGATDPDLRVPYKTNAFRRAYEYSGHEREPSGDDLLAKYTHALGFLDAVRSAAKHHGASVTRLEAHDLTWYAIGVAGGYPALPSWNAADSAALDRFRREPEGPVALSDLVEAELARLAEEPVQEAPEDEREARERVARSIWLRRGQAKFRKKLLEAYGGCCAITGSDCEAVLEAAHLRTVADAGSDAVSNGLLLRADVHTLFDLGLLTIDVHSWTVVLAPQLRSGAYGDLHGAALRLPDAAEARPSAASLAARRAKCNF